MAHVADVARVRLRKWDGQRLKSNENQTLKGVFVVALFALVLSILVKTFLVQVFYIPSGSMEETLYKDDRVLVSKIVKHIGGIHRGDVVVFKDPGGWLSDDSLAITPQTAGSRAETVLTFLGLLPDPANRYLIKRVIGVEGDRVKCCDANGRISVNGSTLIEYYVYPGNAPSDIPFDVTVPKDSYWVMGDHRNRSKDSRYHQDDVRGGMVPLENVVGQATFLIWPMSRLGTI